jgi:AcrR family transcriptional regulator
MDDEPKLTNREKVVRRRTELRETIRQAAIEEFALHGFAGASTLGIAQRAGLSKPQLHYYISSKEELYDEVLEHILIEWRRIYPPSIDPDHPADFIRDYVRRKIEYVIDNPSVSRLFANEVIAGAPFMSRRWGPFLANIRKQSKVIQSWVDEGLIKPVDPLLFQVHLWAVTQNYADFSAQVDALLQLRQGDKPDRAHIIEEVTTLFLRACGLDEKRTNTG